MKLAELEKLELEADRALYKEDPELAREMGYTPPLNNTPGNPYAVFLSDAAHQRIGTVSIKQTGISAFLNVAGSVMGGIPGVWPLR